MVGNSYKARTPAAETTATSINLPAFAAPDKRAMSGNVRICIRKKGPRRGYLTTTAAYGRSDKKQIPLTTRSAPGVPGSVPPSK